MVKNSNSGGRSYTPPSTTDFKSSFDTAHIPNPDRALNGGEEDMARFSSIHRPGSIPADATKDEPMLKDDFNDQIPTLRIGVDLETGQEYRVEPRKSSLIIDTEDPSAYDISLLTPDHN